MKRSIIASTLALMSAAASATPVFLPSGSSLSSGRISNDQSLASYVANPAAPAIRLDRHGGGFGFGVVSSLGMDVEIGDVPYLEDRATEVADKIGQISSDFTVAAQLKEDLDGLVATLGGQPYLLNVGIAAHVPLAPLYIASRKYGVFVVDANTSVQTRLGLLDGPTSIDFDPANGGFQPRTDSALYLKAASVSEASLGYSRPIFSTDFGTFSAGVRGSYYMVGLGKTLVGVALADSIDSLVEDELQKKRSLQSGFGVDLGLAWAGENFRLGTTIKNVNKPSFKYDSVGTDCAALDSAVANNCYLAQFHSDRIDLEETYVMDPQVQLDAELLSDSQTWFIGFSMDTNAVNDPLANPVQLVSLSTGYATRSWIIPGIRLGVHSNLAGTRLSYATLGLTLFKSLNLDVAYGLDTMYYNESTGVPRKLALNLGLELTF